MAREIRGGYNWTAVNHDYRHPSSLDIPEPERCNGCRELAARRAAFDAREAAFLLLVNSALVADAGDMRLDVQWEESRGLLRVDGPHDAVLRLLVESGCTLASIPCNPGDHDDTRRYSVSLGEHGSIGHARFAPDDVADAFLSADI